MLSWVIRWRRPLVTFSVPHNEDRLNWFLKDAYLNVLVPQLLHRMKEPRRPTDPLSKKLYRVVDPDDPYPRP